MRGVCLGEEKRERMSIYGNSDAEVFYEEEFIFDPEIESHGHVHASCIVECPNGDLLAVWFSCSRHNTTSRSGT